MEIVIKVILVTVAGLNSFSHEQGAEIARAGLERFTQDTGIEFVIDKHVRFDSDPCVQPTLESWYRYHRCWRRASKKLFKRRYRLNVIIAPPLIDAKGSSGLFFSAGLASSRLGKRVRKLPSIATDFVTPTNPFGEPRAEFAKVVVQHEAGHLLAMDHADFPCNTEVTNNCNVMHSNALSHVSVVAPERLRFHPTSITFEMWPYLHRLCRSARACRQLTKQEE